MLVSHSLWGFPGIEFSQTMSFAMAGLQPKVWACNEFIDRPPTKATKRKLAKTRVVNLRENSRRPTAGMSCPLFEKADSLICCRIFIS